MKIYDKYFDDYIKLNPSMNDVLRLTKYKKLRIHYENNISNDYINKTKTNFKKYLDKINKKPNLNIYDKCLKYNITHELKGFKYNLHLMPISQFDNQISDYVELLNGSGYYIFDSESAYSDFLLKNKEFSVWCFQLITNLEMGINKKLVLPKIITNKLINDIKNIIKNKVYINKSVPKTLQKEWNLNVEEYVVIPIKKVLTFLINNYLPNCRNTLGYSSLPNGKKIYKHIVESHITKKMSINSIHKLGWKEIYRITDEMKKVINFVNKENNIYPESIKEFMLFLQTSKTNRYKDSKEVMKHYQDIRKYLWDNISKYFNITIKKPYDIKPVPKDKESSSAGAYYMEGDAKGTRNGVFYLNMRDVKHMLKSNCLCLSKHEGIPGHHFQIMNMNENKKIPQFIKISNYTAYIEGWALYAENLGDNNYDIDYFGKLNSEMLRALRLVIDTGIHYYNWDFKKCYDLFKKYSIFPDSEINAEIYRYIALPGQALSYKIGELTILKLRKKFKDIKKFHTLVLENGSLPLKVLIDKLKRINL